MNGVELGNIYGSMAAGKQKNRPIEAKDVRAARTVQEASVKYDRTKRPETKEESGVSWVRSMADTNHHSGQMGSDKPVKTDSSGKGSGAGNRLADQTGVHEQTGKNSQNTVGQAGKNGQNTVGQAGKNDQNTFDQTSRVGITTNGIRQTNTLGMVDRQRLAQQKKAKAKAKAKKKNLNYNRREVSAQVLRASKLGMAARALATARTKVSSLRRLVGTGQYDENELRIAIAHAQSIVKTAKKKLGNLKEEQIKEKRVKREKQENALKKQVKQQRIRAKRQQVKRELAAQRNQTERQMRAKEMRCKQLKRRHRGEELADVAEADMKYIKDMDRYRRYGGTGSSSQNTDTAAAAALEIGNFAMRLSDLERTEQALKYEEQQMQQDVVSFSGSSSSGSVDFTVGDSSGQVSGDGGGGAADVAAVGGAVDISL